MSELSKIRDRHYEGVNKADLDLAASVLAPDVENRFPGAPAGAVDGIAGFKMFAGPFIKAFPDAKIRIVSSVESDDTIVVEGIYSGTHTGPLQSPQGTIPPTGKKMDLPFADIFKVKGGKVVAHHLYFDQVTFLTQLGLMPQPARA